MTKDVEFLIRICKAAAELITDEFILMPAMISAKAHLDDLVTDFDLAIERFLVSEVKKEYPDFDIVSEEFNSAGQLTENCFTIDPIDGTVNFAHGLPLWGIQVACVRGGKTVASVIYMPKLGELYHADESGAYLNGKSIRVSSLPFNKSLLDFSVPVAGVNKRNTRATYCAAVQFAWVAAGRLGGIYHRNRNLWDIVPGRYLVEQAGGVGCYIDGYVAANSKELLQLLMKECNNLT